MDYQIQGYTIHQLNLELIIGRGMAIYINDSLEKSVTDIPAGITFEEACLLEIKLRGGDRMLFGSFYF